jgi:phosphatidylglycerol:prolipoprotein diacylglycerol transferase
MFPTLQIGPVSFPAPALAILLATWIGLSLAERFASQHGLTADALYNLTFTAIVAGLLGARLTYVARYPSAFIDNPASLISLSPALLDLWGGLSIAVIAAFVYGQRKQLPLWPTLDAITPALAVVAVGIGLSHLASGSAFGQPTDLPWAIQLWGQSRHPSQIYEILAALVTLGLIWPRKAALSAPAGRRFLTFVALSAGSRLFLEAFRGDSTLLLGGLRAAQIVAWLILATALYLLLRFQKQPTTES